MHIIVYIFIQDDSILDHTNGQVSLSEGIDKRRVEMEFLMLDFCFQRADKYIHAHVPMGWNMQFLDLKGRFNRSHRSNVCHRSSALLYLERWGVHV